MKKFILILPFFLFIINGVFAQEVVINEFLASNDSAIPDQSNEFDDWIELYNPGDQLNLSGYFLSDNINALTKWTFPDTTIGSESYLIIWADEDTLQEGLHADFKLSASGESVFLVNPDTSIVDEVYFGTQYTDISYGRYPNGTGEFIYMYPSFQTSNTNEYSEPVDDIFNTETVHKFELFFDVDDWEDSLKYYFEELDESYYPARLVYNDDIELDSIGVRYKGNSSYTISRNSRKKPLKFRFDKFIDDQKLLGVERLNFSNCVNDPTFVRETLAYEIVREYMPAPRSTYANIYVNGELIGFYVQVEQVDEIFLADNFQDNTGNLFKSSDDGATMLYNGADPVDYEAEYELKTNEDENDWSAFINMIDTLNNTPDSTFASSMSPILDLDNCARLLAFNMVLSNFDSYTGSGRNFYFYQNPDSDQFNILPWDLNESFGVYSNNWDVISQDIVNISNLNQRPLNARILENDSLLALYKFYISDMIEGPASVQNVSSRAEELRDFIEDYVLADPNKLYSDSDFYDNFDNDLSVEMGRRIPGITTFSEERNSNLILQLSDTRVYPGDTDNNGIVDEYDILPIGMYFLETGTIRATSSFTWEQQAAVSWSDSMATYADCNGDGVVNEVDVIGIGVNWGNTHVTASSGNNNQSLDLKYLKKFKNNFEILYHSISGESESGRKIKSVLESIIYADSEMPQSYSLGQNFPNPFNPETTIPFTLADESTLTISVYNVLGQLVCSPVKAEKYQAGKHQFIFDASSLSSGTYLYQLKTENWKAMKKMVVLK